MSRLINSLPVSKSLDVPFQSICIRRGENAGNQHFLLFLQCFQKASYSGVVKTLDWVVRVKGQRRMKKLYMDGVLRPQVNTIKYYEILQVV